VKLASISYFEYTFLYYSGQVFYEFNEMKRGTSSSSFSAVHENLHLANRNRVVYPC
jgi:hypothetical protein